MNCPAKGRGKDIEKQDGIGPFVMQLLLCTYGWYRHFEPYVVFGNHPSM